MKKLLALFVVFLLCSSATHDVTFVLPRVITNGMVVGTVSAYDPDKGQKLKYSIISGNSYTSFKISSSTGVLSVNNAAYIKSRTKKYFSLVIRVTDNGIPPLSAQATVTVITRK